MEKHTELQLPVCSQEQFTSTLQRSTLLKRLQAFRRFTSVRGTPEVIFSDSGTQLVGVNAIIQAAMREMDRKHATEACKDIRWEFAPGGAPWRQGCAEH